MQQLLITVRGSIAPTLEASAEPQPIATRDLLRLPEGRAALRGMLTRLPQHYNWQFAFLKAFSPRFERPLDVEKWWALSRAQILGREPATAWSLEESWRKLDQALRAAVLVRAATNDSPLRADVPLQTVLREWEPQRQILAFDHALRQLELLRPRLAPELAGLVEDYSQAIKAYTQQQGRGGTVLPASRKASQQRAVEAAIQQLDALDVRRQAMLSPSLAPEAVPLPAASAPPLPKGSETSPQCGQA